MRYLIFIFLVFPFFISAQDSKKLTHLDGPYVVPENEVWKIDWTAPKVYGIGMADLYIDGWAFLGKDQEFTLSGKFDVSLNKSHYSTVWVQGGSTLKVGGDLAKVTVTILPSANNK